MPGDLLGLILSVLLIALCFVLARLVLRFGKDRLGSYGSEVARKIVHIGVSNWFFIYYFMFKTSIWAILGVSGFAIINMVLNLRGGFKVLIAQESKRRNWGLIHYPVSIVILLILGSLGLGDKVALGCAVLGMGYGDGLAALVGHKVGGRKLSYCDGKTVAGFVTMAVVTFIVTFSLKITLGNASLLTALVCSLACSLAAADAEAMTPYGLDNISVPLIIYFIASLV